MQPEARQKRIEEYLQKVEFASLEELAQQVGASTSTVRRDVAALETAGTFAPDAWRRAAGQSAFGRIRVHLARHAAICGKGSHRQSLRGIDPAQMKPSSLTPARPRYHAAKYLEPKTPQIITNSLPVANFFAAANRVELILSGGVIYPRLGVLVGPLAVEAFSKIHADVAVMSGGGITLEGVSNSHGLLIEIQRAMIRAAQRVIFCFDSTKLGRRSVSFLCDLDCIDTIVTDQAAPPDLVEALRSRGLQVVIAPGAAS